MPTALCFTGLSLTNADTLPGVPGIHALCVMCYDILHDYSHVRLHSHYVATWMQSFLIMYITVAVTWVCLLYSLVLPFSGEQITATQGLKHELSFVFVF